MSDICFSIFISFSLKKKETGTEHSLYKDTKTFKRNPVIFSPYHPNIYTWKIKRKKTKLDVLLFSLLLIFLNPTVLMHTLCYFFFFPTYNKSCSGCIFSYHLFSLSEGPKNLVEKRTRIHQTINLVVRTPSTFATWGKS